MRVLRLRTIGGYINFSTIHSNFFTYENYQRSKGRLYVELVCSTEVRLFYLLLSNVSTLCYQQSPVQFYVITLR